MTRLAGCVFVVATLTIGGCTVVIRPTPKQALRDFNSSDHRLADDGYHHLFGLGAEAVPLLLANTIQADLFAGSAHTDVLSSILNSNPSRGLVSLYLVEGIRAGRTHPHATPFLVDSSGAPQVGADGRVPAQLLDRAVAAYKSWWSRLKQPTLAEMRSAKPPLEGAGLRWR